MVQIPMFRFAENYSPKKLFVFPVDKKSLNQIVSKRNCLLKFTMITRYSLGFFLIRNCQSYGILPPLGLGMGVDGDSTNTGSSTIMLCISNLDDFPRLENGAMTSSYILRGWRFEKTDPVHRYLFHVSIQVIE